MKRLLRSVRDWVVGVSLVGRLRTGLPPMQLPDSLEVLPAESPEIGIGHSVEPGRLYELFEDVFRGSRAEISERQRRYLPFLKRAVSATEGRPVLDVGAGRGEFMALLTAESIPCKAGETSRDEADSLRARGFDVELGDAVSVLGALGDASLSGVVLNAVIEHLDPEYAIQLLRVASLKVAPGGCMMIETNNPYCPIAIGNGFWMDFSHVRPYTAESLMFYLQAFGFSEVKATYLSPAPLPFRSAAPPQANYLEYLVSGFKNADLGLREGADE
jgi:SAM-dependent methyltransferase